MPRAKRDLERKRTTTRTKKVSTWKIFNCPFLQYCRQRGGGGEQRGVPGKSRKGKWTNKREKTRSTLIASSRVAAIAQSDMRYLYAIGLVTIVPHPCILDMASQANLIFCPFAHLYRLFCSSITLPSALSRAHYKIHATPHINSHTAHREPWAVSREIDISHSVCLTHFRDNNWVAPLNGGEDWGEWTGR